MRGNTVLSCLIMLRRRFQFYIPTEPQNFYAKSIFHLFFILSLSTATFMNESEHCVCPVPCEKTKYQPQLSYAQIPAKYYSEALAKIKHVDKDIMRHFLK